MHDTSENTFMVQEGSTVKPYKAEPVLKERIWGGQKLKNYSKELPQAHIGESWETDKDTMPILIKLIDANDILSIQVHPDDLLAWELEKQTKGKTEAWVVLECDEDAELIAGIKAGIGEEELRQALSDDSLEAVLNYIRVKKGDCIYMPAGTIHSLGKGIVVYEVQQPSDITYRLYDWNRKDAEGKARALHIEKAMQCIDPARQSIQVFNIYEQNVEVFSRRELFNNDYFRTSYIYLGPFQKQSKHIRGFAAITVMSGSLWIGCEEGRELLKKGETWIVPEGGHHIDIQALEAAELLISEAAEK